MSEIDDLERFLAAHYKTAPARPSPAAGTAKERPGWWRCKCGAQGNLGRRGNATKEHRKHLARELIKRFTGQSRKEDNA